MKYVWHMFVIFLLQEPPLWHFLPLKLAEWIAKDELGLTKSRNEWSSEALNRILTRCLVSNRHGDNLHTFHCIEFESELY